MHESLNNSAGVYDSATTLCRCWRFLRQDNMTLGFTDHDDSLFFENTFFLARTGVEGGDHGRSLDFSVGASEVKGILDSEALKEADIQAGLYDEARIETWQVNWMNPDERLLLDVGVVGKITHTDHSFCVEIQSLTCQLQRAKGRVYESKCSATLGDPETCGINLNVSRFSISCHVSTTDGRLSFSCSLPQDYSEHWFSQGYCRWDRGDNKNYIGMIKAHKILPNGLHHFDLWTGTIGPIQMGDEICLFAGCDKNFETCKNKFQNSINFRGFPHIPGHDFLMRHAQIAGVLHDGKSLFKQ